MVYALPSRTPPIMGHADSFYREEWKLFISNIATAAARHAPMLKNILDFPCLEKFTLKTISHMFLLP